MKKFLQRLFFLLSLNSFAQIPSYRPFPKADAHWYTERFGMDCSPGGLCHTFYYHITGDTLISSVQYSKVHETELYQTGIDWSTWSPVYTVITPEAYKFCFRNDSAQKKVYLIEAGSAGELLWYDFNLQVGDTINLNARSIDSMSCWCYPKIAAIDSIQFGNVYFKTYRVVDSAYCDWPDLVEGVGFTGDLYGNNYGYFEYGSTLEGFCSADFNMAGNWTCAEPLITEIVTQEAAPVLRLFPNPAESELSFSNEHSINEVRIFSSLSGLVLQISSSKAVKEVDIRNLPAGVYFVEAGGQNGFIYRGRFVKN